MSSTQQDENCLFCKMAQGIIEVPKVRETQTLFAIRDINPQAPTHILIIPKVHHENAAEVSRHDASLFAQLFTTASELAHGEKLDGYRTVFNTGASAGQSVFHAHLHLLGGRSFEWPPG
jgi:histidine triad (HIT) family protein